MRVCGRGVMPRTDHLPNWATRLALVFFGATHEGPFDTHVLGVYAFQNKRWLTGN